MCSGSAPEHMVGSRATDPTRRPSLTVEGVAKS